MTAQDYIEARLTGKPVGELATALGITERQCLRRYKKASKGLLTKERYLELLASGYKDNRISASHSISRKTLWEWKKKWDFPIRPRSTTTKPTLQASNVDTKWGVAKMIQGYYRISVGKGNPLYNSPLRKCGATFILLHRLVALDDAISTNRQDILDTTPQGQTTFKSGTHIHHIDGDRTNCSPKNLIALSASRTLPFLSRTQGLSTVATFTTWLLAQNFRAERKAPRQAPLNRF